MRILVTGAGGFLGSHLTEHLLGIGVGKLIPLDPVDLDTGLVVDVPVLFAKIRAVSVGEEELTWPGGITPRIVDGPIDRESIEEVLRNPDALFQYSPHKFELFVAEAYRGLGYDVTLTKKSYDEGIDLRLTKVIDGMLHRYVVQCKHMRSPRKRVGVAIVRELLGVVASHAVSAGILVTNALLSSEARKFVKQNSHRLFYVDATDLRALMARYVLATA